MTTLFQNLDSNVLFVVSTLIRNIIRNIKLEIGNTKQLILLLLIMFISIKKFHLLMVEQNFAVKLIFGF